MDSFTTNTSASDFEFTDSNLSTSTSNIAPKANPCPTYPPRKATTTINTEPDKYKNTDENQPSYKFQSINAYIIVNNLFTYTLLLINTLKLREVLLKCT